MTVEEAKKLEFTCQADYPDFDLKKNYIVTKPRVDFYKHILSLKPSVAILTVYKERCTKVKNLLESEVENLSSMLESKKLVIDTPSNFLNYNLKGYFVLIEDPNLIGPFGHLENIKKIKKENSLVAISDKILPFDFLTNPIIISSSRKCFIQCTCEEAFLVLFSVIKFNIIRDDLSVVVKSEEMKKKVQLFLQAFGYERFSKVFLPEECEGGRIVVFSSEPENVDGVDVIYLSKNKIEGIVESKFDFTKGERFLYKIRDLLRALTPAVCKNKKPFPFKRFENLKNTFKY